MKHCVHFKKDLEEVAENKTMYKFSRDSGITGRFEISLFNNKEDLQSGQNGEVVYSKKSTG